MRRSTRSVTPRSFTDDSTLWSITLRWLEMGAIAPDLTDRIAAAPLDAGASGFPVIGLVRRGIFANSIGEARERGERTGHAHVLFAADSPVEQHCHAGFSCQFD
jgi:hypothetical protein